MSFENIDALNRTEEENNDLIAQRRMAMFGNRVSGTNTTAAVFPIGEKVNLPVDLIDENPDNKEIFSLDHIDELAENMKDIGFTGAIDVFAKPDGRYETSAGHRRLLAVLKNKGATIPAIIQPMPDEITRAKKLLSTNIHQRNLSPYEYCKAIDYYRKKVLKPSGFTGDTIKECSRYFMKSPATVKRYIAISKIIPELQELTKNPMFPYSVFEGITKWSEEDQRELYQDIEDYKKANPEMEVSQKYIIQQINFIESKRHRKAIIAKTNMENGSDVKPSADSALPVNPISKEQKENAQSLFDGEIRTPHEVLNASRGTKKLLPLIPLLKTYALKLGELNLEEYDCSSKEATIELLDKLIETITEIKEKIQNS